MKWYQKPVAAVGSLAVTYHEMIRGRRTGVCMDCGRLNHADADRCMCGGEVDENEHPEDVLDDPDAGTTDSLDRPLFRYGIAVLKIGTFAAAVGFLVRSAADADPAGALLAAGVLAIVGRWL